MTLAVRTSAAWSPMSLAPLPTIKAAYLSARLGQAIYQGPDGYLIIGAAPTDGPRPCHHDDFARFQAHWGEVDVLQSQGLLLPALRQAVQICHDAHQALALVRTGYTATCSSLIRSEAMAAAERLLDDAQVAIRVLNHLATPLPRAGVDLEGAIAQSGACSLVNNLYRRLHAMQPACRQVWSALQVVLPTLAHTPSEQQAVQRTLVTGGLLCRLTEIMYARDEEALAALSATPYIVQKGIWTARFAHRLVHALRRRLVEALAERPPVEEPSRPESHTREAEHARDPISTVPALAPEAPISPEPAAAAPDLRLIPMTLSPAPPDPVFDGAATASALPDAQATAADTGRRQQPVTAFIVGGILLAGLLSLAVLWVAPYPVMGYAAVLGSLGFNLWGLGIGREAGFADPDELQQAFTGPRPTGVVETLLVLILTLVEAAALMYQLVAA